MLNLSDNELDRLSREAASQHDPGDLMGPQSWERLELHLDKELGRAGRDMSRGLRRGIRRLPFQYAPVLLLVVGVTYYFVKAKGRKAESSGSPPMTVVKTPQQQLPGTASDSSLKNSAYSDKSTSTFYPGGDTPSGTAAVTPTAPASTPDGLKQPSAGPNSTSPAGDHIASSKDHSASGPDNTASGKDHPSSGLANSASSGPANSASSGPANSASSGLANGSASSRPHTAPDLSSSGLTKDVSGANRTGSGLPSRPGMANHSRLANHSGSDRTSSGLANHGSHRYPGNNKTSGKGNRPSGSTDQKIADQKSADQQSASQLTAGQQSTVDPEYVYIQHPFSLRSTPRTSDIARHTDSALLAYAARIQKDQSKKPDRALHINRGLGIGIQFAPDFTSVNALAGDRPGSTLGLTLDYEVLDRLHLGTGLLFSRKNYTARGLDYHVPYDYFRQNGMKPADFIKGTMNMLEIPINLRYDFSKTGGTTFFANVGVSSYLFGKENCNYYYDFFGSEACRKFQYSNTPNGLLASVNLSLGVETKLNNSLYALIAPYMKLPTGDMGFGKVRMSSVGINFAIRFTPVINRKRSL